MEELFARPACLDPTTKPKMQNFLERPFLWLWPACQEKSSPCLPPSLPSPGKPAVNHGSFQNIYEGKTAGYTKKLADRRSILPELRTVFPKRPPVKAKNRQTSGLLGRRERLALSKRPPVKAKNRQTGGLLGRREWLALQKRPPVMQKNG